MLEKFQCFLQTAFHKHLYDTVVLVFFTHLELKIAATCANFAIIIVIRDASSIKFSCNFIERVFVIGKNFTDEILTAFLICLLDEAWKLALDPASQLRR